METFLGSINIFGFNFAPLDWSFCNGKLLSVAQNSALFSLLGTMYGGDGQSTFALPDLRSRLPICMGQGNGLSNYDQGQMSGQEHVTILTSNMPAHNHTLNATTINAGSATPLATSILGQANDQAAGAVPNIYTVGAPNVTLSPQSIGLAGGGTPISPMNPYLALNFCIALSGIYPSRN